MITRHRARADESARRVNAAVELLAAGLSVPEACRQLGQQHRISERQARRYVERARDLGPQEVVGPKEVFTVKLPGGIVRQLRAYAQSHQRTFSSLVAEALKEFLGGRPAGPPDG